jgi:ribosomal protein L37AE/L43A
VSIIMKCAQCGADMIAPEWSEHVSERRVRNFWSCEACGDRFQDTVYFSSPEFGGTRVDARRRR